MVVRGVRWGSIRWSGGDVDGKLAGVSKGYGMRSYIFVQNHPGSLGDRAGSILPEVFVRWYTFGV